jgi:hypothetical protein
MGNVVILAVGIGIVAGVFAGFLLSKAIVLRLSEPSSSPRIVIAFAAAGGLAILLPALFLSFVVGGNLGGGWGAVASENMGIGSVGVPFGLAAGIAIVLCVSLTVGTLLGSLLGKVFAYALQKSAQP